MSTEELKPCPFCGQPDRAQHLPTCWFLLRDIGASRARLAEAWNRRAAPAAGTEKDALAALNELAEEAHANGNDWDGCIIPLVNRVRAAIEAGTAKDTERLDYMITEECQIVHMTRPGAASLYRVRWPGGDISQRDWSASGREAIDAAVAVEEPPCSS